MSGADRGDTVHGPRVLTERDRIAIDIAKSILAAGPLAVALAPDSELPAALADTAYRLTDALIERGGQS